MTNEALDLLARLTDLGAAEADELKRGRSNFRSTLIRFKADIPLQHPVVEHETINGTTYNFFLMELVDVEVRDSVTPTSGSEDFQLKIRLPRANAKGETKLNFNSETGQMLNSLKVHVHKDRPLNVTDMFGLKGVEMEERIHKFAGRELVNGEWGDTEMTVRYYHVTSVGGVVGTNGSGPTLVAPVAPTEVAIARALELIKDAGTGGIKESEFNLACTKDNIIKADRSMPKYLTEGKLVSEHAAFVERRADMLVYIA